jgi:hypothetical protein
MIFPDLQLFNLTDDVVAGNAIPAAVLYQIIGMGLFYISFYLALAWAAFFRKEL